MNLNAQLLVQATKEDFPSRTIQASNRIAGEFSKTFDRTVTLMRRVIFWDWSNNNPPPPDDKRR